MKTLSWDSEIPEMPFCYYSTSSFLHIPQKGFAWFGYKTKLWPSIGLFTIEAVYRCAILETFSFADVDDCYRKRFNLKFFAYSQKYTSHKASLYFFQLKNQQGSFLIERV